MALTEESRIKSKLDYFEERKSFIKQMIDASARYERLLVNKDFQEIIKDLKTVVEVHKGQIELYVRMMANEDSPFKRLRMESVIMKHQIRKDQLEEAVNYPDRLLNEVRLAKEELSKIHEEEKQYGRSHEN